MDQNPAALISCTSFFCGAMYGAGRLPRLIPVDGRSVQGWRNDAIAVWHSATDGFWMIDTASSQPIDASQLVALLRTLAEQHGVRLPENAMVWYVA